MSKTYSMPGWRVGFAVGNERLIAALARVKSYLDYGAFTPIQVAAASRRSTATDCVIDEVRSVYQHRRDVMVESFVARRMERCHRPRPRCSCGSPIPDQFAHLGSLEFAKLLIQETGVAVAPGVGFGEYGDQYVRLALVENEQRIRQSRPQHQEVPRRPAQATAAWCHWPRRSSRPPSDVAPVPRRACYTCTTSTGVASVPEDDHVGVVRQAAETIAEFGAWSSGCAGKSGKLKHAGLKLAHEPLSGAVITGLLVEVAGHGAQLVPGPSR